ncbi:MAG: hypothetical protein Q9227_000222 [Pyrenula ochraceoflavens]
MYWECRCRVYAEDGTMYSVQDEEPGSGGLLAVKLESALSFITTASGQGGQPFHSHEPHEAFQFWYRLMFLYSRRNMTDKNDKLPALAGLAAGFRDFHNCTYIAGLWKEDLIRGLQWVPSGASGGFSILDARMTHRAPSWSWASVDGVIYWHISFDRHEIREVSAIVDVDMESDEDTILGQHCQNDTITIRGPMQQVEYIPPQTDSGSKRFTNSGSLLFRSQGGSESLCMDHAVPDFDRDQRRDCWVIALSYGKGGWYDWEGTFYLLLEQVSEDRYRRMGHCYSDNEYYQDFEERTIVLI